MRTPLRPTRRALLTGTGAALLAACASACDLPTPGGDDAPADGSPTPEAQPDPDRRRVESAVSQAEELLALVTATVTAHPALADRLAPLETCHRAHLAVLTGDGEDPDDTPTEDSGDSTSSPSPSGSPTADGSTAAPTPAASPDVALRQLRAREEAHATALTTEAGVAESGSLARLLASMSAGVRMHLAALEQEDAR